MSQISAPLARADGLALPPAEPDPIDVTMEPEPFPVPGLPSPGLPGDPVPTATPIPRFAGEPVWWVRVPADHVACAVMSGARRVYDGIAPGLPGHPSAPAGLIEVTPLPRHNAGLLGRLLGGVPVQYVLCSHDDLLAMVTMPNEEIGVVASEQLLHSSTTRSLAWVGFVRQDRICRDPRAWVDDLDAAAQGAGGAAAPDPRVGVDASWTAYRDLIRLTVPATVRISDHVGRPLLSGSFTISTGGGPAQGVTLSDASKGDTQVEVGAGGAQIGSGIPSVVLASTSSDAGTLGSVLRLSATDRQVSVLQVDEWMAPRSPGVVGMDRWTTGNTVEPIVDGSAYFARLVPELRLAKGSGAVGLAGWAFIKDGLQDPTKPWSLLPEDNSTEVVPLIDELVTGGAAVRILATQRVQITDADLRALADDVFVAVLLGLALLGVASSYRKIEADPAGWVLIGLGAFAVEAGLALLPTATLRSLLSGIVESSQATIDAINALHPGVAVFTPYPVTLADNPLADNPLRIGVGPVAVPVTALKHVGVYHQKIALAQQTAVPQAAATDPIAYLGGVDIDSDRVDDPTHRAVAPFHDVQVRLTGPAVKDVVATFAERAAVAGSDSPISVPAAGLKVTGRHVVQVGRTYFAPGGAAGHGTPFPSAPQGENTTHQTLLAAIMAAKDFIYIEDQYLTPDKEYVDALVAAAAPANGVKALLITVPERGDQPYGELRRGDVIHALAAAWGDRFRIGAPKRRYLNPSPQAFAGLGRMVLRAPMTTGDDEAYFGPAERIPPVPFWAFIDSELVYVESVVVPGGSGSGPVGVQDPADPDPIDQTWVQLKVQRGPLGGSERWGATADKHHKGACVLAVQLPGIYVHAKLMVVDDVFVSVGSSNLNRRGLEHDGEVNVFTVPESLKRDPDNPALRLRCRLWAEHLGLPPEMGLSLLADPISALRYFDRSWYRGSHWQPLAFASTTDPPAVPLAAAGGPVSQLKDLLLDIVPAVEMQSFWATLVDPTTSLDPHTHLDPHTDPPMDDRGPHL